MIPIRFLHGATKALSAVAGASVGPILAGAVLSAEACGLVHSDSAAEAGLGENERTVETTLEKKPVAHSLVQLIANPEHFKSARAFVTGYLFLGPDPDNVDGYLSLGRDLGPALEVHFGPCEYTPTPGKLMTLAQATEQLEEWRHFNHGPKQGSQILVYAEVSGIFEAQRREESLYKPGVICGVSSIEALKPRTDIAE